MLNNLLARLYKRMLHNIFSLNTDGSINFWAPQNGAHTSGSLYPRSELRELKDWTIAGTHQMNVTVRVTKEPQNGAIVIGQVHVDGISGSCSVILELEWNSGTINAHVRDKSCNNVQFVVGKNIPLGAQFQYYVEVTNMALTVQTTYGSTTTSMKPYSYNWSTYQMYFKAGDYVQSNVGAYKCTAWFKRLCVSHGLTHC